jgi:2-succinyl-6-hydroxy-2,4-cyclohexadiene-1-carboxylate synthase
MVFVPGFTQTARAWCRVVELLPATVEAATLDVPEGLDFASTAHALCDEGGSGTYVGYSMGGRLCLQAAIRQPDVVEGLVLVSASPGIADARERKERRESDEALARGIERDGVDSFLERWLAQPLFASLPADAAGVEDRRRSSVARLTHQLRALGQGTQPSLWDRLPELRVPVHLVTGELDVKYTRLAAAMASRIPNARVTTLAGAGHAVHLESPEALAHLLSS